MSEPRHVLSLLDLEAHELQSILDRARELKSLRRARVAHASLPGRVLGLIFEKSSTRTRVSFEAAMAHLGGYSIFLSPNDTQLGRGEPVEDTARVVSRMVDLLAIRTFEQSKLERFASHSRVPVINALTDLYHPCQILADVFTYEQPRSVDKRVTNVVAIADKGHRTPFDAAALLLVGEDIGQNLAGVIEVG